VLTRVCEFAGLAFDPAMLAYHRAARARLQELQDLRLPDGQVIPSERRLWNHRRTSEPPDPSRIGRWRLELKPAERLVFTEQAGALLAELGYDCAAEGRPRPGPGR